MKNSTGWSQANALRTFILVLLPIVYVSIILYQATHLHQSSLAKDNERETASEPIIPAVQVRAENVLSVQNLRVVGELLAEDPTPAPAPAPAPTSVIRGRRTTILITNYRDTKRCVETLKTLFNNAAQPELFKLTIHDQIYENEGEKQCVDAYCLAVGEKNCRRNQIVSVMTNAKDAAGTSVARAVAEKEFGYDDFCMEVDSHMVFVTNWDEQMIQQWEDTGNENAILTVYPKSSEFLTDHSKDNQMGIMCYSRIETPDADAMVQYLAVGWVTKTKETKPRLHSQFAGGFAMGPCRAFKEVPSDPYTPILFFGEEFHRAARFWTAGYDFYAPSVDFVYHYYEERTKIWSEDWGRRYWILQKSKRRARHVMGLPVTSDDFDHSELEKYGLGKKRTFEQWTKFAGVDPLAPWTNKTWVQFDNCKELEYVPFDK